jgi:bifunctional DNA-binding transcriptional regulator/antitoxin component of YhaV-PrlF toxin-antitoxin module
MAYATITPKFQVHIPVEIRKKAGLTKHGRVRIKATKGRVVILPLESEFLMLGGKYTTKGGIPAEKIRKYVDFSDGKK